MCGTTAPASVVNYMGTPVFGDPAQNGPHRPARQMHLRRGLRMPHVRHKRRNT